MIKNSDHLQLSPQPQLHVAIHQLVKDEIRQVGGGRYCYCHLKSSFGSFLTVYFENMSDNPNMETLCQQFCCDPEKGYQFPPAYYEVQGVIKPTNCNTTKVIKSVSVIQKIECSDLVRPC